MEFWNDAARAAAGLGEFEHPGETKRWTIATRVAACFGIISFWLGCFHFVLKIFIWIRNKCAEQLDQKDETDGSLSTRHASQDLANDEETGCDLSASDIFRGIADDKDPVILRLQEMHEDLARKLCRRLKSLGPSPASFWSFSAFVFYVKAPFYQKTIKDTKAKIDGIRLAISTRRLAVMV